MRRPAARCRRRWRASGWKNNVHVEIEFLAWLGEQLGGPAYRARPLLWRAEIDAGETVGTLFARLAGTNETFRRLVFDPERGRVDELLMVVLNDRLLDLAGGLEARLRDGDRLAVLAALAGG